MRCSRALHCVRQPLAAQRVIGAVVDPALRVPVPCGYKPVRARRRR